MKNIYAVHIPAGTVFHAEYEWLTAPDAPGTYRIMDITDERTGEHACFIWEKEVSNKKVKADPFMPCPFCGERPYLSEYIGGGYIIHCNCGMTSRIFYSVQEALSFWNDRA